MKLWVDDVRPAPNMYVWLKSVDEAKECIEFLEEHLAKVREELRPYSGNNIEIIDIDHDAGDYARFGGDYIKLLEWLEETGRNYPIRIHSMNPVGVENMRRIIQRNGWTEVLTMDVREKLVELLINKIGLTPTDAEIYANDFITNGVTVQEWIPVYDRLPDKPMRCLVYTKRGGYCGYDITYYNQGFYSEYSKVTHWMPLPEPPEEGTT